jgi:hypothetical protein
VARQLLAQDPALTGAPLLRQALEAQRQRFLEAAQLN